MIRTIDFTSAGKEIIRDKEVESDTLTIGRAADNDIHQPDLAVEQRHARIEPTTGGQLKVEAVGTLGFTVGVPIDIVALPVTIVVDRSQPPETRDPFSTYLFPSWALWSVGKLLGAPFDAVEWAVWRSWQPTPQVTAQQRESIERQWDAREFSEYPVTPIYPR